MAITKLGVYNKALTLVGQPVLEALTDLRDERYSLDAIYDLDAIDRCLEIAQPKFATKTASSAGAGTGGGITLAYTHTLPADYLNLVEIYSDTELDHPVVRYINDGATILCDYATVYIRYTHNTSIDESDFTGLFADFFAAYLARSICIKYNKSAYEIVSTEYTNALQAVIENESDKEGPRTATEDTGVTGDDLVKLRMFNSALGNVSKPVLGNLTDDREELLTLDNAYNLNAVDYCLEVSEPKFATLAVSSTGSASGDGITLAYTHALPADYIKLVALYSDAEFDHPITRYINDGTDILTDYQNIYIRYVHNNVTETDFSPAFTSVLTAFLTRELAAKYKPEDYQVRDTIFTNLATALSASEKGKESDRPATEDTTVTGDDLVKLRMFNSALIRAGKPVLGNLTDDREELLTLNNTYNLNTIDKCLEVVQPRFASTTVESTGVVTATNVTLAYTHTLPADYINLVELYSDAELDQPVSRYIHDGSTILCDYATLYIRYTHNTVTESDFSPSFTSVISTYLARAISTKFAPEMYQSIDEELQNLVTLTASIELGKDSGSRPISMGSTLSESWRKVYNNALQILGRDPIPTGTYDHPDRLALDVALDSQSVATVLRETEWTFGVKTVKLEYDVNEDPDWGYEYVFAKPADLHRLAGVFEDEYTRHPYKDYVEEEGNYLCNRTEIYVKYISNSWLNDPSSWDSNFSDLVAAQMAKKAAPVIDVQMVGYAEEIYKERKSTAMSNDAVQSPPQVIAEGSWVKSRRLNRYMDTRR